MIDADYVARRVAETRTAQGLPERPGSEVVERVAQLLAILDSRDTTDAQLRRWVA